MGWNDRNHGDGCIWYVLRFGECNEWNGGDSHLHHGRDIGNLDAYRISHRFGGGDSTGFEWRWYACLCG